MPSSATPRRLSLGDAPALRLRRWDVSEKRDSCVGVVMVRGASVLLLGIGLLVLPAGCSKAAAKQRCTDLVTKATQFAESPEMNGARSVDEMRRAFEKQGKLFDDAEVACRDVKDANQLSSLERGRQALSGMRAKAEADAKASLERDAAKSIQDARDLLARAKAALKKSDYKTAAPLLLRAVTAVAMAEGTRRTCIGLVDSGACGDGGAPSEAVRDAILEAQVKSWVERGKEGGVVRGPSSQDSADLVEEVHTIWVQNVAALNAALASGVPKTPASTSATSTDQIEAKVRGDRVDAELLVPQFVRDRMKDADSYEYVSGVGTGVPKGPYWMITWTWKGTNSFGATVQNTEIFCVSAGTAKTAMPCPR